MTRLESSAPAKINLTLRVLARRADGNHELASLVAFAAVGDTLSLSPGGALELAVDGPFAEQAGPPAENLVVKAAREAAARIGRLRLGRFALRKRLPVGAGLGGGSADAAAALRLMAQANDLAPDDQRLFDAARATSADVPVCLEPRARLMHGIGNVLSPPLELPALHALLVFPGRGVATRDVFGNFSASATRSSYRVSDVPRDRSALIEFLAREDNDLESAASAIAPVIQDARALLERTGAPELVRMSGSGSALFAIHRDAPAAERAGEAIRSRHPDWWVAATTLS